MAYTLQFGQVTPYLGYLAAGALLSLQIAAIAFVAGWGIGIVCASVLHYGRGLPRMLVRGYVTTRPYLPDPAAMFQVISQDLEDVGITIEPTALPWNPDYLNAVQAGLPPELAGLECLRHAGRRTGAAGTALQHFGCVCE